MAGILLCIQFMSCQCLASVILFVVESLPIVHSVCGCLVSSVLPFPFLAFLFLCRRFISCYPGLSVSRLRLFLFPSFALCLSRSVFCCLPLLFSVSMSLPLVLSPCLSHPLLTLFLSLFLCSYMRFSAYLSFSGSLPLSLSCPVSPLLSRRSPSPPPPAAPPPPSLGASPQSLFGWAGGLAGGGGLWAGGGGRERGRAEEGGGWC